MGSGTWTKDSFKSYSTTRGYAVDSSGVIANAVSNQEMFKSRTIDDALNPKNVIRECCDSEEHPNTVPVILALDVTGSMGDAAVEVAKKLNIIMTKLYDKVTDVEFMVMGIGDLVCDRFPIQASQFEADIRIAEQLDKLYFEFGGGGNSYESYTAAWYFGSRHTKLYCWKRGKKGIIITMGDEQLNPYLPAKGKYCGLADVTGDALQDNIETSELFKEVSEKFDIYHLDVAHRRRWDEAEIKKSFKKYMDDITDEIVDIITQAPSGDALANTKKTASGEIIW